MVLAGLALATFALCVLAAQQRDVSSNVIVHRIGFLALRPLPQIASSLSGFKDGMRELGYLEGKHYILEVRLANDDPTRYPALVAELSQLKVEGPGRIYLVEPTGAFMDDPNLTDKKYPGNPTKSYRSREPLRVVSEHLDWQGHAPEEIQAMKDAIAGLEPIDD